MQYPIRLPADYDMEIIRTRVATRGSQLDALPGLYLKAYAIQERGAAGARENQYAPFYLWDSTEAMSDFITGPGFRGICASFGRPVIHHSTVVELRHGAAKREFPHWVTRRDDPVLGAETLDDAVARVRGQVEALASQPALHTCAATLDPSRWIFTVYALWSSPRRADGEALHQVLHLSMPSATAGMRMGAAPTPS